MEDSLVSLVYIEEEEDIVSWVVVGWSMEHSLVAIVSLEEEEDIVSWVVEGDVGGEIIVRGGNLHSQRPSESPVIRLDITPRIGFACSSDFSLISRSAACITRSLLPIP
jgi:hypothetical protein